MNNWAVHLSLWQWKVNTAVRAKQLERKHREQLVDYNLAWGPDRKRSDKGHNMEEHLYGRSQPDSGQDIWEGVKWEGVWIVF